MAIRSLSDYFSEYKEFYQGVLELAKIEDKFCKQEASYKEEKEYRKLMEDLLEQCPKGTSIEDLIGLAVVGERLNAKN